MSEETTRPLRADAAGLDPKLAAAARVDKDAIDPSGRSRGKKRRKVSYLTTNKIDFVDYKEVNILRRFTNERGKIVASRQNGNTANQQRMITSAIKKAREMALLPFAVTEISADRKEYGGGRRDRYRRDDAPPAPVEAPAAE